MQYVRQIKVCNYKFTHVLHVQAQTHRASQILHQNVAIILRRLCVYGKTSFKVLIPSWQIFVESIGLSKFCSSHLHKGFDKFLGNIFEPILCKEIKHLWCGFSKFFIKNMGQTRPLFSSFSKDNDNIEQNLITNGISIDCVLEIRTLYRSLVGTDESTELLHPPYSKYAL